MGEGKEATQTSVSKSRRELDMELLLEKRKEEQEASRDALDDDSTDVDGVDEDISTDDDASDVDDVPMMTFLSEDGTEYKVPMDARATLKIDGEEIRTPVSKITQQYQKGAAGDIRMQAVTDLKRKLEQREATLSTQEAEFLNRVNTADKQKAEGNLSDDDYKAKVKELVEAVVEADEDKAVELFSTIYRQPEQDPLEVERNVTAKVAKMLDDRDVARNQEVYQKQVVEANTKFEDKYKDLVADPFLYDMVNTETVKISQEKPSGSPWDIIKEAAERVKKWRAGFKTSKSKRSTPTPASGRSKIGEDPKPPPTRKDVLNKMREARGQPAL